MIFNSLSSLRYLTYLQETRAGTLQREDLAGPVTKHEMRLNRQANASDLLPRTTQSKSSHIRSMNTGTTLRKQNAPSKPLSGTFQLFDKAGKLYKKLLPVNSSFEEVRNAIGIRADDTWFYCGEWMREARPFSVVDEMPGLAKELIAGNKKGLRLRIWLGTDEDFVEDTQQLMLIGRCHCVMYNSVPFCKFDSVEQQVRLRELQ